MGWSIGFDEERSRDIGYGVPANCDHQGCTAEIDRGLGYVCGGEPFGGEYGCGLFICGAHMHANKNCSQLCQHCADRRHKKLTPSADVPAWVNWKMTDESWQQWRDENPEAVAKWQADQQPVIPSGALEDRSHGFKQWNPDAYRYTWSRSYTTLPKPAVDNLEPVRQGLHRAIEAAKDAGKK